MAPALAACGDDDQEPGEGEAIEPAERTGAVEQPGAERRGNGVGQGETLDEEVKPEATHRADDREAYHQLVTASGFLRFRLEAITRGDRLAVRAERAALAGAGQVIERLGPADIALRHAQATLLRVIAGSRRAAAAGAAARRRAAREGLRRLDSVDAALRGFSRRESVSPVPTPG
jgi:hypothetical protein